MSDDIQYIHLAALQHYAFCPRQCALIHNEEVWLENYLTTQGKILHERVDSQEADTRKNLRSERSVRVINHQYHLVGQLDLLEIDTLNSKYYPVEYKRGHAKITNIDLVQLCAQALCLEEMLATQIELGYMWYWETRRRVEVKIDAKLRTETLEIIAKVRDLLDRKFTPPPIYTKSCQVCSLYDICNPKLIQNDNSQKYFMQLFKVNNEEVTE